MIYEDVLLNADKTLNLFVYDLNWGGGSETLIHCELVFKQQYNLMTTHSVNNIFSSGYSDSYISYDRVGGDQYYTTVTYPWGSFPYYAPNGLYIDVAITYHY